MKTLVVLMIPLLCLAVPSLRAQQEEFNDHELKNPAYRLLNELHGSGRGNRMLNVPPQDGRFLQMLVRMNGVKEVLEVGTSNGVSAIWMALGLRETGGRLVTLEIDPERAALARENFRKAGVSELVRLIEGDARTTLPTLDGSYGLVFLDAAKEQYKGYLDTVWERIPVGGVIVAHNAVAQARAMRDYLDHVHNHPELQTVMLRTGSDGMAVSLRVKAQ